MNIKQTFLKLTEYTIPHYNEQLLEKYLPKGYIADGCGNYYIQIGTSRTIFTCHMDTASYRREKVKHVFDGDFIETDGSTILGGDDKNGMTILLYMIWKKVPGTYYFFSGEESGMVGAQDIIRQNVEFFKDFDRMISFDRRGYYSIITKQMGTTCCSEEFSSSLSVEFKLNGMDYKSDPTGIFTDSASFMGIIPEVTNLSCGYFNEHTHGEVTNIAFVELLAKTACKIKWETLPTTRKAEVVYSYENEWDWD